MRVSWRHQQVLIISVRSLGWPCRLGKRSVDTPTLASRFLVVNLLSMDSTQVPSIHPSIHPFIHPFIHPSNVLYRSPIQSASSAWLTGRTGACWSEKSHPLIQTTGAIQLIDNLYSNSPMIYIYCNINHLFSSIIWHINWNINHLFSSMIFPAISTSINRSFALGISLSGIPNVWGPKSWWSSLGGSAPWKTLVIGISNYHR